MTQKLTAIKIGYFAQFAIFADASGNHKLVS